MTKKRNRIAIIAGFPPDPYGEAHYAGMVYHAFAEAHPKLEILVLGHKCGSASQSEPLRKNLMVRRVTRPDSRLHASLALLPLLVAVLRFRPAVVHFQGVHTPRYGGIFGETATLLMLVFRICGIKCIYTAHSIWMPGELAMLWGKKGVGDLASRALTLLYRWNIRAVSYISNVMSFVVAGPDSPMVEAYVREYDLLRKRVAKEIHPCAPVVISALAGQASPSGGLRFGAVGFVREDKAYHLLIKAAEKLLPTYPSLEVIVAGEPQGQDGVVYSQALEAARAEIPSRENIKLRFGYLSEEEFSNILSSVDVIVVPYALVMGPSGPIHHALGYGKPVIASRIGHNLGLADVCELFTPNDVESLCEAMVRILANPVHHGHLIAKSIGYAKTHTWASLAENYSSHYRSMGVEI